MKTQIVTQILELAISLLIVWVVAKHYESRTFARDLRYRTFAPRFWAGPVDTCVMWPVSFVASILYASSRPAGIAVVVLVVDGFAWLAYTVVMHARYGQTVGKMVTRVRVVDYRTEGRISWRQAVLREAIPLLLTIGVLVWEIIHLVEGTWTPGAALDGGSTSDGRSLWILMSLSGMWWVAEIITMLTNSKRRALHDFLAGTVVVRLNLETQPVREEVLG
jgi:uncharacterized RDD family membrane protein YckC